MHTEEDVEESRNTIEHTDLIKFKSTGEENIGDTNNPNSVSPLSSLIDQQIANDGGDINFSIGKELHLDEPDMIFLSTRDKVSEKAELSPASKETQLPSKPNLVTENKTPFTNYVSERSTIKHAEEPKGIDVVTESLHSEYETTTDISTSISSSEAIFYINSSQLKSDIV